MLTIVFVTVGALWILRWVPVPPVGVIVGFFSGKVPQWGWFGDSPVRERFIYVIRKLEEPGAGLRRRLPPLSQRVAELLFYPHNAPKWGSGLLGMLIRALWGEERIIVFYLNSIRYGSDIYGVKAAAHAFFHKDIESLTPSESAELILRKEGLAIRRDLSGPLLRERDKLEKLFISGATNASQTQ
ncbi:MAG: transglycosylase domain-containing protein [Bacteroidia bacterium]|nr:transglycosylase domain-containing protein [Bacteroidia bacterium]MCX7651445.1 transglycosylase domain-containing protein [Bacteroidia bacterium]MDW8416800.1 transglycosylase domain-containing protein [Bacteroidia bacterium]